MYKILFLCPLLALLSGCEPPFTRSQQLAVYRTRCLEYGYEPGTLEFADCMKEQEKHQEMLDLKQRKIELLEEKNQIARKELQVKEKVHNHDGLKIQW
jgi:hypothetical protein